MSAFAQSLRQTQSRHGVINPRNTTCIPVVKILAFLYLGQN